MVAAFTGSPAQHATELMAHLHNNFNIDRQNVGMTMPKGVNVEECVILYSGVNFFLFNRIYTCKNTITVCFTC